MIVQQWMWGAGGAALALALAAGIAESRRNKRHNLDRTGWVPWQGIQIVAIFAALAFTILALKAS
jgi:hypothetical protein